MSGPIQITLTNEGRQALGRIQNLAGAMQAAARALNQENQLTVARIQSAYLSFPKSGPVQKIGCRVITNRLRGSIRASEARIAGNELTSSIGSNVKYARILEEGGTFKRVQLAGSVRLRTDKDGRLLRQKNGKLAVFASARHKQFLNVPFAGGRRYEVTYEGRHFVRRGIEDRRQKTGEGISRALVKFWQGEVK